MTTIREDETVTRKPAGSEELNGIDTDRLHATIDAVKEDPTKSSCKFFATTAWDYGTRSRTTISHYELGGEDISQNYSLDIDEPEALLGKDTAPNPQMVLYAALNACVLNTFVVNAAAKGIRIDRLELDLEGELDLRGFLGIDESVNPGYNALTLICRVAGSGTPEEYEACLEAGTKFSPNFQSISRPVKVNYRLEYL